MSGPLLFRCRSAPRAGQPATPGLGSLSRYRRAQHNRPVTSTPSTRPPAGRSLPATGPGGGAAHRRGRHHRGEDRHRPDPSGLRAGWSMNPNGRQGKGSPSFIRPSEVHERRTDRVFAGQRLGAPRRNEPATHPYHGTTRNRCANRRSRRSRPTVGAEVIGSLSAKLCALPQATHWPSRRSHKSR